MKHLLVALSCLGAFACSSDPQSSDSSDSRPSAGLSAGSGEIDNSGGDSVEQGTAGAVVMGPGPTTGGSAEPSAAVTGGAEDESPIHSVGGDVDAQLPTGGTTPTEQVGGSETACNDGFSDDGQSCIDIDECATGTDNCDVNATCNNTEGGFECFCNRGYDGNGVQCTDADTCPADCDANATCIDGHCTCDLGYHGDGITCADLDECALDTDTCDTNADCNNTDGGFVCICPRGFAGDGRICMDVDECESEESETPLELFVSTTWDAVFATRCTACHLPDGFAAQSGARFILSSSSLENGATADNLSRVVSYLNDEQGQPLMVEKALGRRGHGGGAQLTAGSPAHQALLTFIARYERAQDGTCDLNATCRNEPGTFACECNAGFTGDGRTCIDVDECASGTADCDSNATCSNTAGGFECTCNAGHTGDGETCSDEDACADDCHSDATCTNGACLCNDGFEGDGILCSDINECTSGAADCDANAACNNTVGGFVCICNSGFSGNGRTCQDTDECAAGSVPTPLDIFTTTTWPAVFENRCTTCHMPGGFAETSGAEFILSASSLENGATADNMARVIAHIDDSNGQPLLVEKSLGRLGHGGGAQLELGSAAHQALLEFVESYRAAQEGACDLNAQCTNEPGSFACECREGYEGDGRACTDIDECQTAAANCDANASCTNTSGGFECVCNAGYTGDGTTCADNDACATDCDANATCSDGACVCDSGYLGDGTTCVDIDECATGANDCDANADCNDVDGGFVCVCKPGFVGNGIVCTDVNECASEDTVTPLELFTSTTWSTVFENRCTDCHLPGGFAPNRGARFMLAASSLENGATADNMANVVAFIKDEAGNPLMVRKAIGELNHGGGAQLTLGSDEHRALVDFVELYGRAEAGNCDVNASCSNTPGSFECACNAGYTGDGTQCTEINECSLGTANCDVNATCANTAGSFECTCNRGYSGDGVTCNRADTCAEVCDVNASCNAIGNGRECQCNPGFDGNGLTCADENECLTGNHNCHANADCTNDLGGFTCACRPGFNGDGTNCVDINECDDAGTDPLDLFVATTWETVFAGDCSACHLPGGIAESRGARFMLANSGVIAGASAANMARVASVINDEQGQPLLIRKLLNTHPDGHFGGQKMEVGDAKYIALTAWIDAYGQASQGDCDINAECINEPGTFSCECKAGYSGDGTSCTDTDECQQQTDNCDPNATCTNTPGSFSCACNNGYSGDGVSCEEEATCAVDCDANATCMNIDGNLKCVCNGGYTGNGESCIAQGQDPNNECACPNASQGFVDANGSACVLKYFKTRVWPVLKSNCVSCHAQGQIGETLGARWHLSIANPESDAGLEYNFNEVMKVARATGSDLDGNLNSLLVLKPTGLFQPEDGKAAHIGGIPIPPDSKDRAPLDTLASWALNVNPDFVLCDDTACLPGTEAGTCGGALNEDNSLNNRGDNRDERAVRRLSDYEYNRVLTDFIHPGGIPTCITDADCLSAPKEACVLGECALRITESFTKDADEHGFRNSNKFLTTNADRTFAYLDASEAVADYVVANLANAYAGTTCSDDPDTFGENCAKSFIRAVGKRLYRRALAEGDPRDEVAYFYDKYANDDSLSEGGSTFAAKMKGVLQIMLNSPLFLFRTEVGIKDEAASDPANGIEVYKLTEEEIATSIGFLVTGRGPDNVLIDAIDTEDLTDPAVIASHVTRLAASETIPFKGYGEGFFHDWLGLDRVYRANPNAGDGSALSAAANALFDPAGDGPATKEAIVQDALGFALEQLATGTLQGLMNSQDVGLANGGAGLTSGLATLYNGSEGDMSLPDNRKGILTRAAVAVAYSLHDGPSPIFRGKFVRQRFFCFEPAPPPPGVNVELEGVGEGEVNTTRARFEQHKQKGSSCENCHRYMDPLGNTLGKFDQFGAFRNNEPVSGIAIDTTGSVEVTCDPAADPTGLGCQLLNQDDLSTYLTGAHDVRECIAEQLAGYTFGEYETASIREVAAALTENFEANSPLKDVVGAIAQSTRFTQRRKITVAPIQVALDPCAGRCDAATQTCRRATGQCVLKAECELDGDCSGATPKCVGGQCVEAAGCATSADCFVTEICDQGTCIDNPNISTGSALTSECGACIGKVVDGQPLQTNTWCLIACKDLGGCSNVPVCEPAPEGQEPAPSPCLACLSKNPQQVNDEYCFNQCAYGDGSSCTSQVCTNEYGADPAARDAALADSASSIDTDCNRCKSDGEVGSQTDLICSDACRNNANAFGLATAQEGCGGTDPTWGCIWAE